jgi:hypothetical protein
MRAYTITSTIRPRAWLGVAALVLAVCSLVIPSTAGAQYSSVNSITGGSQQSSQPLGDSDYASANSITGGSTQSSQPVGSQDVSSGYSSLNSITGTPASEPTLVSGGSADDGFDWLSAAIGAAAAMALAALGSAAFLTVRRRTAVSPSPASTS